MTGGRFLIAALLVTAVSGAASPASGQGLGSLRKKAEDAKKKAEAAVDRKPTVDSARATVAPPAASPSSSGSATAPAASPPPASAGGGAAPAKPNDKVWENYDFVPGNKVI